MMLLTIVILKKYPLALIKKFIKVIKFKLKKMQKKYWNIIENIMKKKTLISKKLPLYFIQDANYKGGKINKNKENIFHIFDDKQLGYNYQISTVSLLKLFDSFIKKNNNQKNNSNDFFYMKATESNHYYKNLHKNNK